MSTKVATEKVDKTVSQKPIPKCQQISAAEKNRLFDLYIHPNLRSVYTLVQRYTSKSQDVEDNYSYCLLQLFKYIGSYNPEQKLTTWIHICVKRACQNQNMKRSEEQSNLTDIEMCSMDDLYGAGSNLVVEDSYGTLIDNLSDEVYSALMRIPPLRLSPFMLLVQGLRIREITEAEWKMGHLEKRSEDIVKSRIYWARAQFSKILREHGITRKSLKSNSINRNCRTRSYT